jgi:signal transduction histidine kinase
MANILIVEENPDRAEAIERMLRFAAHQTQVIPNGLAALQFLEDGNMPDALIANILMGGIDGFQLCRTIKLSDEWAQIPIILLSEADSLAGDDKLARRAGAVGFLRRPLQRDALLESVDAALLTASVQDNPLTKYNPAEETAFLRDYTAWLSQMLYYTKHQLDQTTAGLDLRDAHVYAINTVTTALGENLDLQETLRRLVETAADLLRAQAVAIYVTNGDEGVSFQLGHVQGFGIPTPNLRPVFPSEVDTSLKLMMEDKRPVLFETSKDGVFLQRTFALDEPPATAILSPLIARGEVSGFLIALRVDAHDRFTIQDVEMMYSLAGATGLALRSAQLFNELDIAYQNLQDLDRRKSEFVAITSHELRTPIAIMLGYASLLQDTEQDPNRRIQLATIEKQANFLSGMVDALLNLHELSTKVEEPIRLRCQPIQCDLWIQNAVEATLEHSIHKKDIPIIVDCDPIQIEGDEIRLLLVMTNLLDNAIKFSDDAEDTIKVRVAERPEGGIIITVEDQGIGIEEQYYERIFEPFFQVEPAITRHHGGLGLGLAIVKGIVELHGGTVEVISKLGEGSRFIVTLPPRPPEGRCSQPF